MGDTTVNEVHAHAWKEAITALAAFAEWLERTALPGALVEDAATWRAFLRDMWPMLGNTWTASTEAEIQAAAATLGRLMDRHRVRAALQRWLPAISPACSPLFSTVVDTGEKANIRPLPAQGMIAIRARMASMRAEAGVGDSGHDEIGLRDSGHDETISLAPRYANAVLVQEASGRTLNRQAAIDPGRVIRLRLDIGKLSAQSAVIDPEPIPEHLLPATSIRLDVVVSSTHFQVGTTRSTLGASQCARGRFTLPRDGCAARTAGGRKYLYFFLRAPVGKPVARARIGYYYRNHLIQSQILHADVGATEGSYYVEVDYTLSESLVGLDVLPARPQVSIVANHNGDGKHQIVIRSSDETGEVLGRPCTYEVDEYAVGRLIEAMRAVLRKAGVAPVQKRRRRDQLVRDLSALAPFGWQLWNAIVAPRFHDLYDVLDRYESVVMQVSRPATSSYAFPWGLIYDIPLISDAELQICPLVDRWDGVADMVSRGLRRCPEAPNGHDENTLCPFGFWGYRYPIEQLSSTDRPVTEIPVPRDDVFDVVAIETERGVNPADLAVHIGALRRLLLSEFPSARLREARNRAAARELLGRDTPLVYFYCHGERPGVGDPGVPSAIRREQTYLGIDKNEKLTPTDISGWVVQWRREEGRKVWDKVRPLIFINACHSAEINPDTLVSYLDAFVGTAHAAGVIGTEVRVDQRLAMDVAVEFLGRLFQGWTVDHALHAVRLDYLASGNLLGLVYTPYCMADLSFSTV